MILLKNIICIIGHYKIQNTYFKSYDLEIILTILYINFNNKLIIVNNTLLRI